MTAPATHQTRVAAWMLECFGEEISSDKVERNDRFLEEALELVQSTGYSPDRAHALVRYVFGRPAGEPGQEVGGVQVTLAALCNAHAIDMDAEARREVDRITQPEMVLKIRAKQAAKPTGSALPVAVVSAERLGAPEGVRRSRIALPSSADRRECCIACDEPLRNGDRYLPDADGGAIHYVCCGPERESYTDSDGEPLRDDAPIRQPSVWVDERASATMQGAMERLGDECWSLVCKEYPTGGDDYDVGYEVISYHMARPTERLEGFGSTPRTALQSAGLLALSAETTVSRPSQVAQVEEAGPDVRLDSEKAEEWPAAKKALWHVVTDGT